MCLPHHRRQPGQSGGDAIRAHNTALMEAQLNTVAADRSQAEMAQIRQEMQKMSLAMAQTAGTAAAATTAAAAANRAATDHRTATTDAAEARR